MVEKSFASILNEKLQGENSHRPSFYQDPAYLSFLIGKISQTRLQPHFSSVKSYSSQKTQAKNHGSTEEKQPHSQDPGPVFSEANSEAKAEVRRPHLLTEKQEAARQYFVRMGQMLPLDFTDRELKQAFRSLARMLHPDSCRESSFRNGEAFIQLKKAYEQLRLLFS